LQFRHNPILQARLILYLLSLKARIASNIATALVTILAPFELSVLLKAKLAP
jgi:hypothetical protein